MHGTTVTTLTAEAIEQYRNWCIARGRSANTVKAYCSDLREFLKAAGEDGQITKEEYEELAMSWLNLTRNVVSPKTTARRLTSLRSFGKRLGIVSPLEEYIAPQPGRTVPHPIPEGPSGVDRMIAKAKNYEQEALVSLIGFVGCRVGEALSLTVDHFDTSEMMLTIRGKGDKTRIVPVSQHAWTHIQSAWVLALNKSDRRIISYKDRFARQIITNLGVRAGLQRPVSSHDLRATFATAAYDKTRDIRLVQELLGHASSQTTEIYTGVTEAALKEAVEFNG